APPKLAGRMGQCPHCGVKFRIPVPGEEDENEDGRNDFDDLEDLDDLRPPSSVNEAAPDDDELGGDDDDFGNDLYDAESGDEEMAGDENLFVLDDSTLVTEHGSSVMEAGSALTGEDDIDGSLPQPMDDFLEGHDVLSKGSDAEDDLAEPDLPDVDVDVPEPDLPDAEPDLPDAEPDIPDPDLHDDGFPEPDVPKSPLSEEETDISASHSKWAPEPESPRHVSFLFDELWRRKQPGMKMELQLADGDEISPERYNPQLSRHSHGVFAIRNDADSFIVIAVAWESVRTITLKGIKKLPPGFEAR
ncbi:MAG: hypothetical protein N2C14_11295, partial [Planctomycetales bacterium]